MKLRVHSLFLKAASRPFSAMFGPDWKEGHNLFGRGRPVELKLPKENAATLKLICAIIHHQNNMVPQTLAAGDVSGIAVTADKYDCINALFARNWLQPPENEGGDIMILNHGGPYLGLSCEEIESAMAWKVFCKHLDHQLGHFEYMTDWSMYRSARRTKKPCKAESSRNTIGRNKGRDQDTYSQVWIVKQKYICLFEAARKTGPLANALALYL